MDSTCRGWSVLHVALPEGAHLTIQERTISHAASALECPAYFCLALLHSGPVPHTHCHNLLQWGPWLLWARCCWPFWPCLPSTMPPLLVSLSHSAAPAVLLLQPAKLPVLLRGWQSCCACFPVRHGFCAPLGADPSPLASPWLQACSRLLRRMSAAR